MKHYGQRDGLPNVQVYDLLGGTDQLLYLGTANGLYRFNGIRFDRIAFEGQPTSISYISESNQTIWCKDFSNRLFYLEKDTLRELSILPAFLKKGLLVNYQVVDSTLYLATRQFLIRYSLRTKKHEILSKNLEDSSNIIDFKISQSYLALAINGSTRIYSLPGFSLEMEIAMPPFNTEITGNSGIFYLAYRGTYEEDALEINPKLKSINRLGKLPAYVHSNFIRVWQNKLFWCTNNGVYEHQRTPQIFERSFLANKRISDFTTDSRGNHWVSTLDHGIYLLPYAANQRLISPLQSEERVTALAKGPDGGFLAGTNMGSILTFSASGASKGTITGKSYDQIQFLDFDEQTGLLYFTHGIADLKGNLIHKQFLGRSLARDRLGNYLFAAGEHVTMAGEQLWSMPLGQKKERYIKQGKQELNIRRQRARKVLYDSFRGIYLVAFTDKLMAYSVLGDEFEITAPNGRSLVVNEMYAAPDNTVWLGTLNDGIWLFKGSTSKPEKANYPGLSGNFIKKIVGSSDGVIWVSTDKGLDCFRPQTNRFDGYREILGIAEVYLYDILALNEKLLLATDQGILQLPINPNIERRAPLLRIKSLQVNGKKWSIDDKVLPVAFKNLRIDYLPIHFQSEGLVYAQYRLGEGDVSWSTLPAGVQSLNLYGLPSGKHELELRLMANDKYSESFYWQFEVAYPIWQRWWFIALMAFCLVAATALLSRSYNKRKTKNKLLEEALASSKLTAMKAQMNPHFLYNVLNSIQGLIYANKKEEAADYLSKFSDLMRLTLNFSDKQWHEISEEISALHLYLQLEAGRFESDFSFDVRIDDATRRENPLVPSMLIQPYVENAIKHGLLHKNGPKRLTVDFSMHASVNRIIISIEDNGIGRKQSAVLAEKRAKSHRSFATQSLQSRLQILNQLLSEPVEVEILDKKNDQMQATGTVVIIRLPFKYN
ncbi:MAG: hypothetical protein C0424_06045 [Sphingobacteriaceae bacterium]|nr:hypothetical protein [Sphingobacteriaceae bacterium]